MSARGNGFTNSTFSWLAGLEEHNDTTWFADNRSDFETYVQTPFEQLLQDVTQRLASTAVPLRGGEQTTFRVNRDVRFSPDKSPYNTSRSALLTRGGAKAESDGLVYVSLSATGGLLAGGLYKPATARLDPLRQSMLEYPDDFTDMIDQLTGTGHRLDRSDAVKTMPRGYSDHADHPLAEYLRLKQLIVTVQLPKSTWLDDTIAHRIVDFAVGVAPLLTFIRSTAS